MSDFGPKRKNHKTIENQLIFALFGLKRAMTQCDKIVDVATKSLNVHWIVVFSEIEAVKRRYVDRIFIDQKSNSRGRICCKNQMTFNNFVF